MTSETGKTTISDDFSRAAARLKELRAESLDIWGDEENSNAFLARRHIMLGDQTPLDVSTASAEGHKRVMNVLGGLRYGSAV